MQDTDKRQVISRCQETIKYMKNSEKKFTGPFVLRKSQKLSQDKYESPLVKASQMKVPFTEIPKTGKQKSEFSAYINSLLENLGIVDDNARPEFINFKAIDTSLPPGPLVSANKNSNSIDTRQPARHVNLVSISVQTETIKCKDCEKRNKITYKSTGVQCGDDSRKCSIGIQVKEDELCAKISNDQSLATLTPAQLLARSVASMPSNRSVDVDDFDLLFPSQKSNTANRYSSQNVNSPTSRGAPGGARGVEPEGSNMYNIY